MAFPFLFFAFDFLSCLVSSTWYIEAETIFIRIAGNKEPHLQYE